MQLDKSLGQIAFEAYNENGGWKTFDGRDVPKWNDLTDQVRQNWEAGALAAGDEWHQRLSYPSSNAAS